MKSQNHQITPISSSSTLPSTSQEQDIITTLVSYGDSPVAIIIAMTYFSHILLKGIRDLLNDK